MSDIEVDDENSQQAPAYTVTALDTVTVTYWATG